MAVYDVDTSALVKRYALEAGSTWMIQLTDPALAHDIFTMQLTAVEPISAMFRKAKGAFISRIEARRQIGDFRMHWQNQYFAVSIDEAIIGRAMHLAEIHGLRGYDAVHVAAAIVLHSNRQAVGLPPLVFLSSDNDQIEAAQTEGLVTDNPNLHP